MRTVYVRAAIAASCVLAAVACATAPNGAASEKNSPATGSALSAMTASRGAHTSGGSPSSPQAAAMRRRGAVAPHRMARGSSKAPEAPQVLYGGGLIVTAPKVVPVIFPGNQLDAQVRQFFASLPGSTWWQEATAEYGVGAITILPVYVPTDPLPTLASIDQWIANVAANPPAGFPAPDNNTIYAIVLPEGWQQDAGVCVTFGGYHNWNYTPSGQVVIHTVNPTCAVPYLGLLGIDQLTDALSHELEESATDPTGMAYAGVNWAASGWATAGEGSAGGETADMCEFQPSAEYRDPVSGFLEQRIWSNAAAAAGHDPCKPLQPDAGPYFTADAVLTDGTQADPYAYTKGVSINPGQTVTIPVVLRSDGPVGEWQLAAAEMQDPHLSPDIYNELSFSWNNARGRAGDTRYLTITRSPPPDGGTSVFLRVGITSTLGAVTHTSWLVVGTELATPGGSPVLAWL